MRLFFIFLGSLILKGGALGNTDLRTSLIVPSFPDDNLLPSIHKKEYEIINRKKLEAREDKLSFVSPSLDHFPLGDDSLKACDQTSLLALVGEISKREGYVLQDQYHDPCRHFLDAQIRLVENLIKAHPERNLFASFETIVKNALFDMPSYLFMELMARHGRGEQELKSLLAQMSVEHLQDDYEMKQKILHFIKGFYSSYPQIKDLSLEEERANLAYEFLLNSTRFELNDFSIFHSIFMRFLLVKDEILSALKSLRYLTEVSNEMITYDPFHEIYIFKATLDEAFCLLRESWRIQNALNPLQKKAYDVFSKDPTLWKDFILRTHLLGFVKLEFTKKEDLFYKDMYELFYRIDFLSPIIIYQKEMVLSSP
jgi:hypothetical protein